METFLDKTVSDDRHEDENRLDCIQMQLDELELLASMYQVPDELTLAEFSSFQELKDELKAESMLGENSLEVEFDLKIKVDDVPIQLTCHFPQLYPMQECLTAYVRCISMGKADLCRLNQELKSFLSSIRHDQNPQVMEVTQWLMEQIPLITASSGDKNSDQSLQIRDKKDHHHHQSATAARYWIYSHHIFSKFKRRDILKLADEYSLSGFCLPGKPGIICIEGHLDDCEYFYDEIRSWCWKKLMLKEKEVHPNFPSATLDGFRKFDKFREESFDAQRRSGREFRMDFGKFSEFLLAHNCGDIFKLYFGFDGMEKPS